MKPFRALIVDDEPLAVQRLTRLLQPHEDQIAVISTALTGSEAMEKINILKPDLLFLDINLGSMTGFDVLSRSAHSPLVIFTTAYDTYALQAFETHSVDYLLKPIAPERLAKALAKLDRFRNQNQPSWQALVKAMQPAKPARIQVKQGDRIKLVDPDEILYFRADHKYVELVTADGAFLMDLSLTKLEAQLDENFIRTHRSVLVNADFVDEIGKDPQGGFYVQLKDAAQTRLPLSRQARARWTDTGMT